MPQKPDESTISIWLSPDQGEQELRHAVVAEHIGVSVPTFRNRLRIYGEDHNMTYYPGKIPCRLRRGGLRDGNAGARGSLLKDIKVERIETIDYDTAVDFIIKLITTSQRDFERHGCVESRDFLLNVNGMLEWYIEALPRIKQKAFLEDMKKWVLSRMRN